MSTWAGKGRNEYKEPFKGGKPQPGLCMSKKQKHTFVIVGVHRALRTKVKVSTGPEGPDLERMGAGPGHVLPFSLPGSTLKRLVGYTGAPEVTER